MCTHGPGRSMHPGFRAPYLATSVRWDRVKGRLPQIAGDDGAANCNLAPSVSDESTNCNGPNDSAAFGSPTATRASELRAFQPSKTFPESPNCPEPLPNRREWAKKRTYCTLPPCREQSPIPREPT
eukprot:gene17628-biopygen12900